MKFTVLALAVALLLNQVLGDPTLVSQASNSFSNKLYEQLAKEPGNLLVCPLSLHIALSVLLQGAKENSATQLATTLGFSGDNANIKNSYKSLLTEIQDQSLKIATKLFPSSTFSLNNSFVHVAQEYFLSGVEGVNVSNPVEAAETINKYVEENTDNKIHDLIAKDAITEETVLIIVNAIYFQGKWKHVFTATFEGTFKVSASKTVQTTMMSTKSWYDYKEDATLDAKVLKMDYEDGGYSMVFILPNQEDGLTSLEAKLSYVNLDTILKDLSSHEVDVTIPKFRIEKTLKPKEALKSMGLKDVFDSNVANLKGISKSGKLYVSDVIQKTYINVHENGTEAAAATGVTVSLTSANLALKYFYANHPFHFILCKNSPETITLFEGRLVSPSD